MEELDTAESLDTPHMSGREGGAVVMPDTTLPTGLPAYPQY